MPCSTVSKSVLQVVDDALYSVTEAGKKTTKDTNVKFKKATDALSAYEKKYHLRETVTYTMAEAEAKDKSSSTILKRLKETLRVRNYSILIFASPHTNTDND
jgi:hypothetical protein